MKRPEPSDSEVTVVQVEGIVRHMKSTAGDNLLAATRSASLVSLTSALPVDNSGLAQPSTLSDSSQVVDSMDDVGFPEGSLVQVVDGSVEDLEIPEGPLGEVVDGSIDDLEIPQEPLGQVVDRSVEDLDISEGSPDKVADGSRDDLGIYEGQLGEVVDGSTDGFEIPEVPPGSMGSLGADRAADEQGSYMDVVGAGIPNKAANSPGTERAEALVQQPQVITNDLEAMESQSTHPEVTVPGEQTSSQEELLPLEEPGRIAESASSLGASTDTHPAEEVAVTASLVEDISEAIHVGDVTLPTISESKDAEEKGTVSLFERASFESRVEYPSSRWDSESSKGTSQNKKRSIFRCIGRLFTTLFRGKEEKQVTRRRPVH